MLQTNEAWVKAIKQITKDTIFQSLWLLCDLRALKKKST